MGSNSGKSRNNNVVDDDEDLLMKQNADMVKHLAEDNQMHKRVNQMSNLLLNVLQSENNENLIRNDRRQIEIDGIIYYIKEFVNRGGFGEIYKGEKKSTNELVAIKIMKNSIDIQEEIQNEIEFLNLIKNIKLNNHPIIDYYGCKITNDGIFIVMELAICDLLTFWFNQIKQINLKEKFFFGIMIIVYVLRALTFLEKLNLIHGDIKPQNLVIVQERNSFSIKLIDFGTIEKMSTQRNQLTVDANKAYTIFFASPEFLKRNSNHLITRHLHKKSDAWAAGVMFYFLFFEKLPWKDQYDYENFCNNTNAKDIQVPQQGSYKLIIELLLKKNPQQRSSAKHTLMQIKYHPIIKNIIQTIEQNSYPIDDVCHIRVPDHVKQQLRRLAKPGHFANSIDPSSTRESSRSRHSCRYGRECYRHDRDHRGEYSHPGDSDFNSSFNNQLEKKKCRYGEDCFRTDIEHRQKYIHPNDHKSNLIKEKCRYGEDCFNTNIEHRQKYIHPNNQNFHQLNIHHSNKEKCRYGNHCNKTNDREHMNKYLHN